VDPPLPLSRLRARGQLTEIRAQDLRFTSEEAADFLNQAMGLSLAVRDVEALEERTEGWAVGLQMAALSLQGRADVEGFIGDFTGSHRYVLDYLTEEVLSRQPEPVREFLLRSSVLSRLSAPLSAAVTGRDDAQAILERLDATNLFLIPLDDTRTWYRYHHLFGTLLRHQLERQEGRPAVVALHERASQWYSDHGHPEDALEHALAAGAMDRATELVTEHALPRLMRADAGTVIRWIRSLPAEWLERRPKLRLSYAWALVSQLELKAAEEHVDAAERALEATPDPELAGHVEVLRGMLTRTAGRNREAVALYRSALTRLPEDSHFLRGVLFLDTGTAWLGLDDLAAAGDAFEQARTECARSGNTFCVLLAEWHLAELYLAQGHLHKAAELARSSLRIAEGRDGQTIPAAAMARGILADVRREWDDLPGAVEEAAKAWELGKRGEIASGLLAGSLSMSRVLSSLGDFPGALAALGRAEEVIRRTGQPHWLEAIHSFRAGVQLRQARVEGNAEALEAASRWARDSGLAGSWRNGPLADTFNDIHRRDFAHLVTARVLLADGDLIRAEELLAALLEVAEETGRVHSVIEGLSLTALARNLQGDRSGAVALVGRALALAEPERYVRLFADEDPALAGLIEEAAPDAVSAEYARKILEAFGMEGPAPVPGDRQEAQDQEMAEPLSDREVEVLRLIATGLSNADAGRKLFIAPSTVKKHLENIYAKLGTRNRTQAIARARDIGVL
ncbi:MAG TPA: LuxR C-terminal-related transcriptional regulator, partial [Thermoanaerobaculia bacterium]|nr:LuxR C-terminal-related transcriptional regulator [Thermoanaerobaculia bacterium]